MTVSCVYIYPTVQLARYYPLAERFAQTWRAHDPGYPCRLHVIGNGGEVPQLHRASFAPIPNCDFREYGNQGWDIGAFQWAAETIPCDLLVCLGAPVHFHRPGWLDRMVEAFATHSPGLFGCWGVPYRNYPHIRTTSFWFAPELLRAYPNIVGSGRGSRYDFEHGAGSFTLFSLRHGYDPMMVNVSGVYKMDQWGQADPGPASSLLLDQHTHY